MQTSSDLKSQDNNKILSGSSVSATNYVFFLSKHNKNAKHQFSSISVENATNPVYLQIQLAGSMRPHNVTGILNHVLLVPGAAIRNHFELDAHLWKIFMFKDTSNNKCGIH
jgi:hypothetical protein